MEHTPTPWAKEKTHFAYPPTWMILLNNADYERAKICVNACEGIEDPAKWFEDVSKKIDDITKDTLFVLSVKDKEIQALQDRVKELEKQSDMIVEVQGIFESKMLFYRNRFPSSDYDSGKENAYEDVMELLVEKFPKLLGS
jgi:hypothetical protein